MGKHVPDGVKQGGQLYVDNSPFVATAVAGAEAADVVNVIVQLKTNDENISDLTVPGYVDIYLSDDSGGAGVTTTALTGGGVAINGGFGNILEDASLGLYIKAQSDATGKISLDITDTGAVTRYLVVISSLGKLAGVSNAVIHA